MTQFPSDPGWDATPQRNAHTVPHREHCLELWSVKERAVQHDSPHRSGAHSSGAPCTTNRVAPIAAHIPWYGFRMQARLARDAGVSASALSRLLRGRVQPSLPVCWRITQALARRLGHPLDLSEVFSRDGTYPTPSVCALVGCRGCPLSQTTSTLSPPAPSPQETLSKL